MSVRTRATPRRDTDCIAARCALEVQMSDDAIHRDGAMSESSPLADYFR